MNDKQSAARAADLELARRAAQHVMFLLDRASQHARDAGESDTIVAGFYRDAVALEAAIKNEIG